MAKILIVDDEPNNCFLMEDLLHDAQQQGVELLFSGDGKQALEIILKEKPELVFLDLMLPEMGGEEVCSRIKSTPGYEGTHIFLLTAKSWGKGAQAAGSFGADGIVAKPFKVDTILQVVRNVLGLEI